MSKPQKNMIVPVTIIPQDKPKPLRILVKTRKISIEEFAQGQRAVVPPRRMK